jgi:hypothetical protein
MGNVFFRVEVYRADVDQPGTFKRWSEEIPAWDERRRQEAAMFTTQAVTGQARGSFALLLEVSGPLGALDERVIGRWRVDPDGKVRGGTWELKPSAPSPTPNQPSARVSLDNGASVVDVASLTEHQVRVVVDWIRRGAVEQERWEAARDSNVPMEPRAFVARVCELHEQRRGAVLTLP